MRLERLEPEFVKITGRNPTVYTVVESLAEAEGIQFLCPKCFILNKGNVGTHLVLCWFEGKVPDDETPGPGRWTPSGTGFHDLTFVPGVKHHAVSVKLDSGCNWHGHVVNGDVTLL